MALYGKFVVNNETLAPLVINGVGTYLAFSGDGAYRNRGDAQQSRIAGRYPQENTGLSTVRRAATFQKPTSG
ncbi:hypothetical protein PTE30175_05015 [Pandoraea terrae]|uniref:Uncharacterized protein n=1 Tax=Pandoraea terrae TaxID=1537710 RepID=A0A5E4Z5Y6_9BURK|nr:hypothetical protein PTE30175_05015 [Pandoraea terrae]